MMGYFQLFLYISNWIDIPYNGSNFTESTWDTLLSFLQYLPLKSPFLLSLVIKFQITIKNFLIVNEIVSEFMWEQENRILPESD